jgi:hydantoinase/carbamoylase family amidase
MAGAPAIDSARVIADLRELARRTSDDGGAQRVCWSPVWHEARRFLGELLGELGLEAEVDEAGNLWARLDGADPAAPALTLGSHIDSVPDGGWLDGSLGVIAGVGVLRAWAAAGEAPPRSLVLVDWADEEGARFGRSLFGSSAFSGTLDPDSLGGLRDAEGRAIAEVLAENDVELDRALDCGRRRDGLGAYLELHIEQGPRMEAEGLRAAAVTGCAGVERMRFTFAGQASHAGTTPMTARRDAGLAAAETALEIERIPATEGGVATTGQLALEPGIPTAIAGEATLSVDMRHPEAEPLARMLEAARAVAAVAAERRGCELAETPLWRIEPIPFDAGLVFAARRACEQAAGRPASMASGALHDAAEVARVLPAVMMFAPSKRGISHAPEEDTDEGDLAVAIEAYAELAADALTRLGEV